MSHVKMSIVYALCRPLVCSPLVFALALAACAPKPVPPPVAVAEVVVAPPPDLLAERPAIAASVDFTPPTPMAARLSNGASVWVVPRPGIPLVSLVLHVPGGSGTDPAGHEGAAWLSDRMMTQGAGAMDARQFSEAVERLGIELDVRTDLDGSWLTVSFKKEQLHAALGLVSDMVLRPRWGPADFKRERDLAVGELTQSQQEPTVVAARMALTYWYGAKHPWGHAAEGTLRGMAQVTIKDAQRYHTQAWNAAGATFTAAGDVSLPEVQAALESLLGKPWPATKPATVAVTPAVVKTGRPLYLIDSPGSAQTMFYVSFPGLAQDDSRLSGLRAGTIVLGGTFTSRLNALLREKRGFTYGAKARTIERRGDGATVVYSRIRTDVTSPAMMDLLGELTAIRQGITAEELLKAKGAYKQDQVEAMESRSGIASTFAAYHVAGLSPARLSEELTAMNALTLDSVKAEMANYDKSKALFMLVGDRAKIEAGLKQAGFDTIEVVEPL